MNVAGAREASNNFLLDGVDNNDLFLNRVLVTPSLDAVQEFTLLTSSYDAEYGRSAGAQVNVVLKSGGQRFSGSAYEFFRDRSLEARGALDAKPTSPSRSGAGISSAAPSAARRRCSAASSLPRSKASTTAPPRHAWRTSRPPPSVRATSRPAA